MTRKENIDRFLEQSARYLGLQPVTTTVVPVNHAKTVSITPPLAGNRAAARAPVTFCHCY